MSLKREAAMEMMSSSSLPSLISVMSMSYVSVQVSEDADAFDYLFVEQTPLNLYFEVPKSTAKLC